LLASPPPAAPAPSEPERPTPSSVAGGDSSDDQTITRRAEEPSANPLAYGSKDGQLFLSAYGGNVLLLPSVRLEANAHSASVSNVNADPQGAGLDLARIDLAGWFGGKVFFDFSADVASASSLRYVDNYVAVAPWDDRVIFQLGQFDAPFTLENRTPDRYLDFVGRGAAVRSFAIPENKDQGAMVHGTNPAHNFYYSAAVMNGAGPTVSGVDSKFDVLARAWIAPFSFDGPPILRDLTVGGSGWTGDRVTGPVYQGLTTQTGYTAADPGAWWMVGPPSNFLIRERGRLYAGAFEVNASFMHRFGARFEWIYKKQPLSAFDVTDGAHPMIAGGLDLSGWATYAEVWGWVLGDDRIIGAPARPGLQLPLRLRDLRDGGPRNGLMLAARVDYVDQDMTRTAYSSMVNLVAGAEGATKLKSLTLGASYWFTRRARLNVNYIVNSIDGDTPYLNGLAKKSEQELLVRTALSL
jgi:hypothetical protein